MYRSFTSNIFIVFLVLFEFTVYMANDLIMPGMLNVVREFNANEDLIPLSLSLYLLGGMLLQIIMGPISDKIGRRRSMIGGCSFFLFCTLLIILSPSMSFFLMARFFQGMGLCFITVCGYASVQELFEEKRAVRMIAWMTTVAVTAPIIGPIFGGFFTQAFDWRWIFGFTLFSSVIALWGLWKYMPETVQVQGIRSVSLRPVLHSYFQILTNRKLVLGGCLNGLLSAPILCWIAISPIVLFKNAGISPELYGAVQIPVFGSFMLGNFVLRKLTYKYSLSSIIQIAFPFCVAGSIALCVFSFWFPDSYWSLILPLSIFCLGNGILSAPLARISLYSSTEAKGIASAVFHLIAMAVMIATISMMPLIFQGKNLEFGVFCLSCVVIIAFLLREFLRVRVPHSKVVLGV